MLQALDCISFNSRSNFGKRAASRTAVDYSDVKVRNNCDFPVLVSVCLSDDRKVRCTKDLTLKARRSKFIAYQLRTEANGGLQVSKVACAQYDTGKLSDFEVSIRDQIVDEQNGTVEGRCFASPKK